MAGWYTNWHKNNIKDRDHLDEAFAAYWGMGPSFSCDIDNKCKSPKCSDLNRPDQARDYENAAMFFASMANFNNVRFALRVPSILSLTNRNLALRPDL